MARVNDYERGPLGKAHHPGFGRLPENYNPDSSGLERFAGLSESFEHEIVVAFVRFGVVAYQAKDYNERLAQLVGPVDRIFQGMVILAALRRLHPIDNILSLVSNCLASCLDSLRLYHFSQSSFANRFIAIGSEDRNRGEPHYL